MAPRRTLRRPFILVVVVGVGAAVGVGAGCASCVDPNGLVAGDADRHCGGRVVHVAPAACSAADEHVDAGFTLFNGDGDDDECKYHVHVTTSAVKLDVATTFTVALTSKADGSPVRGANPRAEVLLTGAYAIAGGAPTEAPAGTYTIGPVVFDRPGRWTVRFHFFEPCAEGGISPRAQAAFFVDAL